MCGKKWDVMCTIKNGSSTGYIYVCLKTVRSNTAEANA